MEAVMSDVDAYLQKMIVTNPLVEPLYDEVIRAWELRKGSRGLDVGCGIGFQAVMLAKAIGPEGYITGVDVEPEFLDRAGEMAQREGVSDRVSFKIGDMHDLPFGDNTFDWLWSANCVGYPSRDPVSLLKELSRVVKPGGEIAILIYASQMLLPGYPFLEARLNATATAIAPFSIDMEPETHHMRVLGWFQQAGLENAKARTFVEDIQAPLNEERRAALSALVEMRWGGAESEVPAEDWAQFLRLTRSDSPDCLWDFPDYYAYFACVLFRAQVV